MKALIILLPFLVCYLPILIFSAFMPYMTRKTESFGVSIPEEAYNESEVAAIRTVYRNTVLTFGIVMALFAFVTGLIAPVTVTNIFLPVGTLVQLAVMAIFYINGHKKMKALKAERKWINNKHQVTVIDTGFRNRKIMVSPLWFMLYVVIFTVTLGIGFSFYDKMPDRIPMQFNLNGEVTRYALKSYKTMLFAPILQVFMTFLMAFCYWVIGKAKQQIDASNPEKSIEQSRIFRYRWSAFIVFCGFLMIVMFGIMQLSMVGLIKSGLFMIFITSGIVGIITIAAVILSITTGQGGSRVRLSQNKQGEFINRDDDRYWKLGVFYFNPDDPSLFVEKRFGIGWTNNFARPMSWVFIIGLLVLIILMAVLSKYMSV